MVSSISSSNNYALQQALLAMQQQQQQSGAAQNLFGVMDSNGSGGTSQSGVTSLAQAIGGTSGQSLNASSAAFTGYDTNGNGALSGQEFMAALESNALLSGGTDSPGLLGTSSTSMDQATAAYSANSGGDGLSALIAGLQNLVQQLQSGSGDQGTSSTAAANTTTAPVEHHHHGGHHGGGGLFKKVDTDGSGGVSMDELSAMATNVQNNGGPAINVTQSTFAAADANGDGQLSPDELKTFMGQQGLVPPSQGGGMASATASDASQTGISGTTGSASSGNTTVASASQKQIDMLQMMLEQLTTLNSAANATTPTSLLDVTA